MSTLKKITEYNFDHGKHRDVNGFYVPLIPSDFDRPLTHEEMDYNLALAGEMIKNYAIRGGATGEDQYEMSNTDIGKTLVFRQDINGNYFWNVEAVDAGGPTGPQGLTGAQGAIGPIGTQGHQGRQGPTGAQGSVGAQGVAGPQGSTGGIGQQGTTGVQGSTGPQGATGAQGAFGLDGSIWYSDVIPPQPINPNTGLPYNDNDHYLEVSTGIVYNYYQNNWVPQGSIMGPQGSIGVQGATGLQGLTGPQGSTGAQGVQGPQGSVGAQGLVGAQGETGYGFEIDHIYDSVNDLLADNPSQLVERGRFGLVAGSLPQTDPDYGALYLWDGSQWTYVTDMSVTGADGIQGPTGPQGTQGRQGPTGPQGVQGFQGAQGSGVDGINAPSTTVHYYLGGDPINDPYRHGGGPSNTIDGRDYLFFSNEAIDVNGNPIGDISQFLLSIAPGTKVIMRDTQNPFNIQPPYYAIYQIDAPANDVNGNCVVFPTVTFIEGTGNFANHNIIWSFEFVTGTPGPQGTTGAQGSQGTQGRQGPTGAQGTQGFQGATGAQGFQGEKGETGASSGQIFYFNESVVNHHVDGSYGDFNGLSPYTTGQPQQVVQINLAPLSTGTIVSKHRTDQPLGVSVIPAGLQRFHLHFTKNSASDIIEVYARVYRSQADGTLIANFGTTGKVQIGWNVNNTNPVDTTFELLLPTTYVNPTDYVVVEILADNLDNQNRDIKFYTEGFSSYSFVVSSLGAGQGETGPQGPLGPQGFQGNQGPTGSQGNQGPTGAQGNQGSQGPTGAQGFQGRQGPIGHQGNQGPQGDRGYNGTLSGNGVPSLQGEFVGQTYIDLDTKNVYTWDGGAWIESFNMIGETGAQGSIGAQGNQGPTGAQGNQGNQGPQGSTGVQGNQGPQGSTGAQGFQGSIGQGFHIEQIYNSEGELLADNTLQAGSFGLVAGNLDPADPTYGALYYWDGSTWTYITDMSVAGAAGVQGPTGPQGIAGAQGNQGAMGTQGHQGAQGEKGFQGNTGVQGSQGNQGPTGPQGIQGPIGFQGAIGETIKWYSENQVPPAQYDPADFTVGDHWLDTRNGDIYEWDGVDWVLQGNIKGTAGTNGAQGNQGPTGPQGSQGVQGRQGPTGAQGDLGAQGFQGRQGPTGPQGFQGNQGPTGPQGNTGAVGDNGFNGTLSGFGDPAIQGEFHGQTYVDLASGRVFRWDSLVAQAWIFEFSMVGAAGAQGYQGVQGRQGPTGPQGLIGAQGNQGPTGPQGIVGPQGIAGVDGTQGAQGSAGAGFAVAYTYTMFIDPSGDDLTAVWGDPTKPWQTIKAALDYVIQVGQGMTVTFIIQRGLYVDTISAPFSIPSACHYNLQFDSGAEWRVSASASQMDAVFIVPNDITSLTINGHGRSNNSILITEGELVTTAFVKNSGTVNINNIKVIRTYGTGAIADMFTNLEFATLNIDNSFIANRQTFGSHVPNAIIRSLGADINVKSSTLELDTDYVQFYEFASSENETDNSWIIAEKNSTALGYVSHRIKIHNTALSLPNSGGNFIMTYPQSGAGNQSILVDGVYFYTENSLGMTQTLLNNSADMDNYYVGSNCISGGINPQGNWVQLPPNSQVPNIITFTMPTIKPY